MRPVRGRSCFAGFFVLAFALMCGGRCRGGIAGQGLDEPLDVFLGHVPPAAESDGGEFDAVGTNPTQYPAFDDGGWVERGGPWSGACAFTPPRSGRGFPTCGLRAFGASSVDGWQAIYQLEGHSNANELVGVELT